MADSESVFYYDRSQKRGGSGGGVGDEDGDGDQGGNDGVVNDYGERTQKQHPESGPRRKKPRVLGSRYDPGFESKLEDILFNDLKKVDFPTKKNKKQKEVDEEEGDGDVNDILAMLGSGKGVDESDEDEEEEEVELKRKTPQQKKALSDDEEEEDESDEDDNSEEEDEDDEDEDEEKEGAAWVDDDDEEVQVSLKKNAKRLKKLRSNFEEDVITGTDYEKRLRQQHQRLQPNTEWAIIDDEKKKDQDDDDSDDDLLRTTSSKLGAKGYRLPQGHLDVLRLKDANQADFSKAGGEITSLSFHHSSSILLCASERDQTVRLFDVDGKVNPKLHGITFRDLPPLRCFFNTLPDKSEVICTGRRKYFYVYDLNSGNVSKVQGIQGHDQKSLERCYPSPDGKYLVVLGAMGYIHVLSNTTKQWIASMKMNTRAEAAVFTPDSRYLITTGGDGSIYQWDMNTRRCYNRYTDSGSLSTLSIALSPNGSLQATGTKSGAVNIYDLQSLISSKPTTPAPRKGLMNLTTGVTNLEFNHDSQILAMSSRFQRDALRLVHMPSLTVFSNWPSSSTPIQTPTAMAFSSKSEMFAVGNQRGAVLLYKLNHYDTSSRSTTTD